MDARLLAVNPVNAIAMLAELTVVEETSAFIEIIWDPLTEIESPFIVSWPLVLKEYPSVMRVLPSKRYKFVSVFWSEIPERKRRLLNIVLSNLSLKDGITTKTYRKTFENVAKRVKSGNVQTSSVWNLDS